MRLARYSNEVINEVFAENDIVGYISQYVKLKKSGRDYSGLCPFHGEKTPSFHVSQEKQLFHCFGCGASGNLVQFVMRAENLDFIEALKLLADRVGIALPEETNTVDNELYEKKQRIYKMNKISARFFYDTLVKSQVGKVALDYFMQRRISGKTITAYGLGYAPDSFDALLNHLRRQGFSDGEIVESGLASQKEKRVYDRFRNRVMFPIINLRGNVIGFGGRIMGDAVEVNGYKPPKYLNSAETPVFNKGRNLFSLNLAKNAKSEQMILVEGYMDVISVYQAGIKNIVATLGTALTENQAKLLLKYCNEICLCYDSDEAGQKATIRAIDIINRVGGKSKVIKLGNLKDPDDYIKANGVAAFKDIVKSALPSTEFKLSLVKRQHDTTSTEGKIKFVTDAADALIGIEDAIEVDAYVKRVSEETGISKEAIYSEYKKKTAKNIYKNKIPNRQQYEQQRAVAKQAESPVIVHSSSVIIKAERKLLNLISQQKRLFRIAEKQFRFEEFSTKIHRDIAKKIYDGWNGGEEINTAIILNDFSGNDINEASSIFYNLEIYEDDEKTVEELIKNIKLEKLQTQINGERDPVRLNELIALQEELRRN